MKNFIFDLDSTLLQLDQNLFLKLYFEELNKHFEKNKKDQKMWMDALLLGTHHMLKNTSTKTNEEVFYEIFCKAVCENKENCHKLFEEFYLNGFGSIKSIVNFNPLSKKIIQVLKEKGYHVGCATTPLFPRIATYQRLAWAGLEPDDFDFVTTYEDYCGAKPNLYYFEQVLKNSNYKIEESIMVGNDVSEDLVIAKLGVKTYLVTDYLINSKEIQYESNYESSLADLYKFVCELDNWEE